MQARWHHGYVVPVSWALLVHVLFFWLLLTPRSVPQPPVAPPLLSYLYTPATLAQKPHQVSPFPEVAPSPSSAKPSLNKALAAQAQPSATPRSQVTAQSADMSVTKAVVEASTKPVSRLAERALASLALPSTPTTADYTAWKQAYQHPVVASTSSLQADTPAASVLYHYPDGKQLVKVGERCLMVEPTQSGFAQLMQAKDLPCAESPDAQLYQRTMAKWLNR